MYRIIMNKNETVYIDVDSILMLYHDNETKEAILRTKDGREFTYPTDETFFVDQD